MNEDEQMSAVVDEDIELGYSTVATPIQTSSQSQGSARPRALRLAHDFQEQSLCPEPVASQCLLIWFA